MIFVCSSKYSFNFDFVFHIVRIRVVVAVTQKRKKPRLYIQKEIRMYPAIKIRLKRSDHAVLAAATSLGLEVPEFSPCAFRSLLVC